MRPFSVLWALGARFCSSLFVQELVLRSPPSISQCERVFVGWAGGQAPYSLEGFSNGSQIFDVSNLTPLRHDLGVVLYGATDGDIVVFRLTDGAQTARYASYRVQPSEDNSCLRRSHGELASSSSHPGWRHPPVSPLRSQESPGPLASDDSDTKSFVHSDELEEPVESSFLPDNP